MGNRLLLPLAGWLDLAEVEYRVEATRIKGMLQPSGVPFEVDASSSRARLGKRRLPLDRRDLKMVGGEAYGSIRLLAELFGLSVDLDPENAALLFHNPEELPVARRLRRESARAIQVGGERPLAPELIHRESGRSQPSVVLTYEVRGSSQNPAATSSYDVGLASGLAGGSAIVRGRGAGSAPPQLEGAWSTAWPRSRWLTRLRLGDGPMSGPRPQISRGLFLTNAPIVRPLLVEDLPFAGTLPPDWSVEAYRAGRLIGFDSVGSTGTYSLTLPIEYGENPVDFVAYGPHGEVRTFNRTFRALPSMVPAGTWEYGLSAGACRGASCRAAANLDLRYGASRRWAVRAGLDQLWDSSRAPLSFPYASIVGAPTNALGVELEGVARLSRRVGLRLEPSVHLRLTGDYISYSDSTRGSVFLPRGTREQWSLYGRLMPGRRAGATLLEAQATRTLTTSGTQTQLRTGAALQLRSMVLRPYLRAERLPAARGSVQREFLGLEATVLPKRSLGPVLGSVWVQGQAEAEGLDRPANASMVLARNLGRGFRIEGGTRWERSLPGVVFTLSLVSQLEAVRSTSLVTAPTGAGSARLDQSVGGAVVWSRGGGAPLFSSEPSQDRGGVGGQVFLDLNADGQWSAGEPSLPGTRLLVGNRWVPTDANGRYQLWGVAPWEELLVSVDTASLASPWWTPRHQALAVMPAPNLVRSLDVPVVIGGIVEGSLVQEGTAQRSLGGPIPLVLTELGSGTRTTVESFSDGSFYRMGLPPGRYQASADAAALAGTGLQSDTVGFELRPGRSAKDPGQTVSGLRLLLRVRER